MEQLPPRGARPAVLASSAAELFGRAHVVRWCEELLRGAIGDSDSEFPDISWLGGTVGWADYWTRVWGARGLLHIGHPAREVVVLTSLSDDSWRVREMSLKVIRRYGLHDAAGAVDRLTEDPVERVRVAAWKALGLEEVPARASGLER
ncbi:HEAT repeat domain-containing protein [Microbacterium koreense]|uniref:HEAT repeat domain-containing protein n=1 Tax=Microbacterium koreense TaxID=323761 RepID=A0ABW2ZP98_9MICO